MNRFRFPFLFVLLFTGASSLFADKVTLIAGGGKEASGEATKVKLNDPFAVDFDKEGNLYFVEMKGERLGKIDPKGMLSIIGGTGKIGTGGDGGSVAKAEFHGMHHLLVAPNNDLYLADTFSQKIRKVDGKTGIITTFAGTGEKGFSGDGGPADKAKFGGIHCLAFDAKFEKLYLIDLDNRRVRMIDMKTNIVTTVAGSGQKGVPPDDSEAVKSPLFDPRAVTVDAKGNIYILERSGHALRVVNSEGKIRTVAGTGKSGSTGDGGEALKATFNGPKHLCVDTDGSVLIADTENHLIRRYNPADGKITRVAGTGKKGTGLAETPDKLELSQPHGIWVHEGNLYISDSSNGRILKIDRK